MQYLVKETCPKHFPVGFRQVQQSPAGWDVIRMLPRAPRLIFQPLSFPWPCDRAGYVFSRAEVCVSDGDLELFSWELLSGQLRSSMVVAAPPLHGRALVSGRRGWSDDPGGKVLLWEGLVRGRSQRQRGCNMTRGPRILYPNRTQTYESYVGFVD